VVWFDDGQYRLYAAVDLDSNTSATDARLEPFAFTSIQLL